MITKELRAVAAQRRAWGFHQPDGDGLLIEERAANTIDDLLAACKRALEKEGDLRGATRRGNIRDAIARAETLI